MARKKSSYKKGEEKCIDLAMEVYDLRTALTDSLDILFTWIQGIPPAYSPEGRLKQFEEIVEPCLYFYGQQFAKDIEKKIKEDPNLSKYWRPYVGIIAEILPLARFMGWNVRDIAKATGYSVNTVRTALWLIGRFTEIPKEFRVRKRR